MASKKRLSDADISNITGIPRITLAKWKNDKESYRVKLYWLLKRSDESFLLKKFKYFKNKGR